MFDVKWNVKVEPDSLAEKYVVNVLCPLSKGKPICRLGALFGEEFNTYTLHTSIFGYFKMKRIIGNIRKKLVKAL